ncbi:MAG: YhcH/YjgK/YiaL family protein [Lachnospiraceae bacterium]|nr:YhcH/YjgK/YiaL family protein [Lachnospiraceae bacterium]
MKDLEQIKALDASCYDFIKNNDMASLEIGRYDLENGSYVLIQSYTSKLRSAARYETHENYYDIQYVIKGKEIISIIPREKLTVTEAYVPEKDITFYENSFEGIDHVLSDGDFLIIAPADGHMPGVCADAQSEIRKAVFKVPVKK